MAEEIERTGVVRGKKIIELDDEVPLPEGAPVRLRLIPNNGHNAAEDEEADKTLQSIYEMRHHGRSIQKP